MYWIHWIQF
jgi:hypothetical protein